MEPPRNVLARIRTIMANERTLLSYYRSALASIGLAAFIYKFFPSVTAAIFAILAVVFGIGIAVYGTLRFITVRDRLDRLK